MSLCVENVSKEYRTQAEPLVVLRNVSLTLDGGGNLAILGPSGSGKSTLLNILGTLEPATSGRVRIDDQDLANLDERRLATIRNRHIGFVFQEHHLLPQCSVLENVLVPTMAIPEGMTTAGQRLAAIDRARMLLDRVELSARLDHRPAELSGGERQRVAIARALINQPTLLLADEPTGNLDQTTADTVGHLLMELHQQEKMMLVVVTHSLRLAGLMSRRMELDQGRLKEAAV